MANAVTNDKKKQKKHRIWPIVVVVSVIGVIIVLIRIFFVLSLFQKAVPNNYYDKQETGGDIEAKYAPLGSYEVESKTFEAPEKETDSDGKEQTRHIKVFYPKDTSTVYPLVIMVNGTGVPYTKYEQVFEHLASWGFVVIGNDYSTTWDGKWTSATLDFALNTEEISSRIDSSRIALGGHSQGGEGTYNAVTDFANGTKYKCLFALSATSNKLACALDWSHNIGEDDEYGYDLSKITIPALMLSGTGSADAGTSDNPEGISPLYSLEENLASYASPAKAVMARRKDADHSDMLWRSDPYVTAWLRYWLYQDTEAGEAFFGENPELKNNTYWQDFESRDE